MDMAGSFGVFRFAIERAQTFFALGLNKIKSGSDRTKRPLLRAAFSFKIRSIVAFSNGCCRNLIQVFP